MKTPAELIAQLDALIALRDSVKPCVISTKTGFCALAEKLKVAIEALEQAKRAFFMWDCSTTTTGHQRQLLDAKDAVNAALKKITTP